MRIYVKVKTGARQNTVAATMWDESKKGYAQYVVSTTKRPVDGQANEGMIKAIADHFGVAPSSVRIISGQTSRYKIMEIEESL